MRSLNRNALTRRRVLVGGLSVMMGIFVRLRGAVINVGIASPMRNRSKFLRHAFVTDLLLSFCRTTPVAVP
jgi:hypothetical protein